MEIYLRSRFTVIWVVSYEEDRLITSLKSLCERTHRRLLSWDLAAFFKPIANCEGAPPDGRDPKTALEAITKADRDQDTVFVLKDFHACLERQAVIIRQLRYEGHLSIKLRGAEAD